MSEANLPNVIDLTAQTPADVYEANRGNFSVKLLVLHDTVGSTQYPDLNSLSLDPAGFQNRENITIRWFQGQGGLSIHYFIGPEATGAKIYQLCKEGCVAYHAGGTANYPSSWHAPDGTFYQGNVNGVGVINWISIGIERWGGTRETPGPKQTQAMVTLASDIARRYNLAPEQIVSHKELEGDRQDGLVLLSTIRTVVSQMRAPAAIQAPAQAPAQQQPTPAPAQAPAPNPQSPGDLINAGLNKLIDFLHPKGTPNAPTSGPGSPIVIGATLSHGVTGVVPYLGAGQVKNNGIIIRDKPFADAQAVRTLNQGTPLRLSAYTDRGSNNGSGPRWYLIDAADGGGWIYGGALN